MLCVGCRIPGKFFYHVLTYGGPHGEIGASLRYLSQRYAMPYPELSAILTDIGSEVAKCSSLPPFFLLGFPGSSANI
ncbi:MAG: hypothetical protein HFE93_11145 [Acutalibacter muris]|nr:hypothetical protein [Acutalibacter muris]